MRQFGLMFNDPYLRQKMFSKKSKILVLGVSHRGLSLCPISSKSKTMMQYFILKCVDLIWNAPIVIPVRFEFYLFIDSDLK